LRNKEAYVETLENYKKN